MMPPEDGAELTDEQRKEMLLKRRLLESDNRADRRRAVKLDRQKPYQSQFTKKKTKRRPRK